MPRAEVFQVATSVVVALRVVENEAAASLATAVATAELAEEAPDWAAAAAAKAAVVEEAVQKEEAAVVAASGMEEAVGEVAPVGLEVTLTGAAGAQVEAEMAEVVAAVEVVAELAEVVAVAEVTAEDEKAEKQAELVVGPCKIDRCCKQGSRMRRTCRFARSSHSIRRKHHTIQQPLEARASPVLASLKGSRVAVKLSGRLAMIPFVVPRPVPSECRASMLDRMMVVSHPDDLSQVRYEYCIRIGYPTHELCRNACARCSAAGVGHPRLRDAATALATSSVAELQRCDG